MVGRMNATNGPLVALIVPVWSDDALVADLINRLEIDNAAVEWIVAAVQPSQSLRDLERAGRIRLVICEKPSRGAQMNAGAKITRAALLCFHHADSELRPEHVASLVHAARTQEIIGGAFHRRFDDRRVWMIWWERLLRRISKVAGPLFGDQSLFVKTDVFRQLGGSRTSRSWRTLTSPGAFVGLVPSPYSIRRYCLRPGGSGVWATRGPYLSIQH